MAYDKAYNQDWTLKDMGYVEIGLCAQNTSTILGSISTKIVFSRFYIKFSYKVDYVFMFVSKAK